MLNFKPKKEISFPARQKYYLIFITIVAAILRIIYQYDREFYGDEIGTLLYIDRDISYILSHFKPWLTMNYFIAIEKYIAIIFGKDPLILGFLPLLAGIILVPLTAYLAQNLTTARVGLVAATLVAINPYLIRFSGVIRSYSLLASLSVIVIILYSRWLNQRSLKSGLLLSFACVSLILMHPYGVYTTIYIALLMVFDLFQIKREFFHVTFKNLILPLLLSIVIVAIAYHRIIPEMLSFGKKWHVTPPSSFDYIPWILSVYFSKGYLVSVSILFFFIGIIAAIKNKISLYVLLPSVLLPSLLLSLQGFSHYYYGYGRFLIFCIPILIIFMAEGLDYAARILIPENKQSLAVAILLAVLAITWFPNIKKVYAANLHKSESSFRKIAYLVEDKYKDGDIIVCRGKIDYFHMLSYLSKSRSGTYTIERFVDNYHHNPVGQRVFIINHEHTKSRFPYHDIGPFRLIIYPFDSKKTVLKYIRDDYVDSVHGVNINRRNQWYYKAICIIDEYIETVDNKDFCKSWKAFSKRKASIRESRKTSSLLN